MRWVSLYNLSLDFRADVANHVTTKSGDQCERHYMKYYIEAPDKNLPSMLIYVTHG